MTTPRGHFQYFLQKFFSISWQLSKQKTRNKSNAKRAKKWRLDAAGGPSFSTFAHVLSHGTCVEVDLDASQFDSAKGIHTGKSGTAVKLGSQADICKEYTN
ncbi:hypothetical protein FB446DRAFT_794889 [Lentinula raphanica]|nr:hypothetical protein FB446DRAFT_794889 [Lentinula raphanica]